MKTLNALPQSFRMFFWDGDYDKLKFPEHENYVLQKLMMYGNLESIAWIMRNVDRETIGMYLARKGKNTLDRRSYQFWVAVHGMEDLWH